MNLLEQAQHFLERKGFLVENYDLELLGFADADSAHDICRLVDWTRKFSGIQNK